MTSLHHNDADGLESVPPAELLRLRNALVRPPGAHVRAQHLAAAATTARHHPLSGPVGRFASRGARVAVAVVASLAITSGLAGAQLLPSPAQRLLSNVSDRFAPSQDAPPATAADPEAGDHSSQDAPSRPAQGSPPPLAGDTPTTLGGAVSSGPTTTAPHPTSTTIPGPIGPGSPEDPVDPEPTTTTTTDPGSTTTTTTDPGSTTTTTQDPGSTTTTTSTTSTTEAPRP